MTRNVRTITRVVALAGLAVLLSGCIKAHQDLTLNEDDTVDGSFIFAFSKELSELVGQEPDALLEGVNQGEAPLPEGVEFEEQDYDDGDYVGKEYTFEDVPIETMSSEGELSITREGDTFVVEGSADLSEQTPGIDPNDPTQQQVLESFDVRLSVTFPGDVSETNGEVDGRTVTWTPQLGEVNDIHAVGSAIATGGGAILVWILLGVAAAIVIAVMFVMMTRKSKGAAPETPVEGMPAGDAAAVPATSVPGETPTSAIPAADDVPAAPAPTPAEEPGTLEPPNAAEPPEPPEAPTSQG